jgi:hypothetical protein
MLIYKDGIVASYKEVFKNTSFPASGITDEFLAENNAKKVNLFKPYNPETEKLVQCAPYEEDGWVYTVKVEIKGEDELIIGTPDESITIEGLGDVILGNTTSNITI